MGSFEYFVDSLYYEDIENAIAINFDLGSVNSSNLDFYLKDGINSSVIISGSKANGEFVVRTTKAEDNKYRIFCYAKGKITKNRFAR